MDQYKEYIDFQSEAQIKLNSDLQAVGIQDGIEEKVYELLDNQEFLMFVQIYMNMEQDQLEPIVHIYLALYKDNYDELVQLMEQRNQKIDEEHPDLLYYENEFDFKDKEEFDIIEQIDNVPPLYQDNMPQLGSDDCTDMLIGLLLEFKEQKTIQLKKA